VVWIDRVLFVTEFLGDGSASLGRACRLAVAIVFFSVDDIDDGRVDYCGQLKAIGSGRLSEAQVDHFLGMVFRSAELAFEDLPDGVVDVGAVGWSVLHLRP